MRRFPEKFTEQYPKESGILKKLGSPAKIQDFLDAMPINFERGGDTARSLRSALAHGEAHCIEGALIAAAALWYHGARPLLMDLQTTDADDDHVVALFKEGGRWGAISKTNHAVLRYRDPIYASVRELAMSYFHEYFLDDGRKTLRSYSAPFDLLRWNEEWLAARGDLWELCDALDGSTHFAIFPKGSPRRLRRAAPIERKAGTIVEQK